MRILIFYKERAIRHALFEILRDEGYQAFDVDYNDGIDFGIELALNVAFDIIIAGEHEWLEIEDQIKGKMRKDSKIILIFKRMVNEDNYKKNGVFGILYYPVDLSKLLTLVESA